MKKFLLCAIMVFLLLGVNSFVSASTIKMAGDANEDGNINATDITKIERIIAGLDTSTAGADANLDGKINACDITKIERIIAGLDTAMPIVSYRVSGLNFSPYVKDGQSPDLGSQVSEAQIRELIGIVAPYTQWIRTFGCTNDLKVVGRIAHEYKLKIAVGAWLSADMTANEEQITSLINIGKAGEADLLIIGSETLLRNNLTEIQLIDYINRVKSAVPGIPVATADTYGELLSHPAVMTAGSVVLPNYYPYWEGVNITKAVAFIHQRHQEITAAAGGKQIIVSESGWPSAGDAKGEAVPSPENAGFFFLNFVSWARATNTSYFYFEAFDEPWKVVNEGAVGAHWGVWDKNGVMKPGMNDVFDGKTMPDNWSGTATPVVEIRSDGFYRDGKRIFMGAGVNWRALDYDNNFGGYNRVTSYAAQVKAELAAIRGISQQGTIVVRVGLLDSGVNYFKGASNYGNIRDDVIAFLQWAKDNDVMVEFTVADFLLAARHSDALTNSATSGFIWMWKPIIGAADDKTSYEMVAKLKDWAALHQDELGGTDLRHP